tara:strand:- start:892 stop:1254 length:363 start_codon:yes stop_codon:yes gene_type:complete
MKTFPYIQDAGHGWARVPKAEIAKAGVEDQITSYSFQKGKNVYLEQDADMQVFVAARTKQGLETKFSDYVNKSRPSRIRNYDPYMPTAVSVVVLNKGPIEELAIDPSKPMTIVGPTIYGV